MGSFLALGLTIGSQPMSMAETTSPSPSPTPSATPGSDSTSTDQVSRARADLEKLQKEQQDVEDKIKAIEQRLTDTSGRIDEKQGDIEAQEKKIAQAKKRLTEFAISQYQNNDAESTASLFLNSESTDTFLDALSAAENIADNNANAVQDFENQKARLQDDKRELEAAKAQVKDDFAELSKLRKEIKTKVDTAAKSFKELDAQARRDIAALESTSRSFSRDTGTSTNSSGSGSTDGVTAPDISDVGVNRNARNTYFFGNCTFYAFTRRAQIGRPVLGGWGNARTWGTRAARDGYRVDMIPEVGAVYVTYGPTVYGHVSVVEKVNGDGSFIVSEMNWVGFNIISTRYIAGVGGVFIH